jgi:aspartyl-tRNA(Asn)/glutamyl-tRNA(Gln) amidotransferase subunit B
VESAIRIGLALNCSIAPWSRFARKNYFYPDMTKDFQTSQYDEPICFDGHVDLEVDGTTYRIEIERVHMEEDAGKLTHAGATGRIQDADYSLVDYNRAGTPLMEIVTKPIGGLGAQAPEVGRAYLAHLRELMLALGVSDARMEAGNLRCDVNISLAPSGADGTRHPHRDQERELAALRGGRAAVRDPAAGRVAQRGGRGDQETRHWHEEGWTAPAAPRSRPRTTATSPSRTWSRSPPARRGSRSCAPRCPSRPPNAATRLQADWGFTDLEMRDVVGTPAPSI